MALTKASDILGLKKKIEEIAIPVGSLSASKVTVSLPDFSATNAAGAFEELKVDISDLSASVLTIGEKIENISEYSTTEKLIGKWIDGSDVYEKTIIKDSSFVSDDNTILHGIENLNKIIDESSIIYFTGGASLPLPAISTVAGWSARTRDFSSTNFVLELGSNLYSTVAEFKTTLKYTKTAPVTTKKTTKKRG